MENYNRRREKKLIMNTTTTNREGWLKWYLAKINNKNEERWKVIDHLFFLFKWLSIIEDDGVHQIEGLNKWNFIGYIYIYIYIGTLDV
jgi:hypothetical protein